MSRSVLPPFTLTTPSQKLRLAEDDWNGRDPARVALAHSPNSRRCNRSTCLMHTRIASNNDLPITQAEGLYGWPAGRRPDARAGVTGLGL